MRVLHVASEAYPLVKTGGLGDVAAALPPAQCAAGAEARLVVPGYPAVLAGLADIEPVAALPPYAGAPDARLVLGRLPPAGPPTFAVVAPALYERPGDPYLGPDGHDWPDNHRRFALLGRTAAAVATTTWPADVVHAHDWHAGLAPAYLRAFADGGAAVPASVFTIHNLAFPGIFPPEVLAETGLPADFFAIDGLEYYGQVSFMKAALFYADRITTVSPTYAREIQQPEQGMGFDGLLRHRAADLVGILNGVDYTVWNSETDPLLAAPYGADDPGGKVATKEALQKAMGLAPDAAAPVFGVVSRLTSQKGLDLVLAAINDLIAAGAQLALLGTGAPALEDGFRRAAAANPQRIAVRIAYDETVAHRIVGGADAIVVPSRFEPCGLTQLFGLRYGTLPLVRRTGGLADTVVDATDATLADGTTTGFVFDDASTPAFMAALARALALYSDRAAWTRLQRRAMTRDFSWAGAARRYLALYNDLGIHSKTR